MVKTSKGEGTGLIPSQQTKIPHTRDVTKNLKKKKTHMVCVFIILRNSFQTQGSKVIIFAGT